MKWPEIFLGDIFQQTCVDWIDYKEPGRVVKIQERGHRGLNLGFSHGNRGDGSKKSCG